MSALPPPPPPPPQGPPAPPPPPAKATSVRVLGTPVRVAMIVGAVLTAIGAFLPWISGSVDDLSVSKSGIDGGDGWFFVGGGVLLVVAAVLARRSSAILGIVVVLALIGLWIFEWSDITDRVDEVKSLGEVGGFDVDVRLGVGMWVMLAGIAIALVGTIAGLAGGWRSPAPPRRD